MAEHKVTITRIPRLLVGANDLIFEIREGNAKLGDLRVSQGNIFWLPSGHTIGYKLEWAEFAQIAKKRGKRRRYTY